jgi:hypothetical protein
MTVYKVIIVFIDNIQMTVYKVIIVFIDNIQMTGTMYL